MESRPLSPASLPGFEPIDVAFRAFIEANSLPGASLAIAKDGRLVLAKSYGFSDVEQGLLVRPDSLFRFASVGKTITAIAVMKAAIRTKVAPANGVAAFSV